MDDALSRLARVFEELKPALIVAWCHDQRAEYHMHLLTVVDAVKAAFMTGHLTVSHDDPDCPEDDTCHCQHPCAIGNALNALDTFLQTSLEASVFYGAPAL